MEGENNNMFTLEQEEYIKRAERNREILPGVVRTVSKHVLKDNGEEKEVEIATVVLKNGIQVMVTDEDFSEYKFRSISGFTGQYVDLIITEYKYTEGVVIGSVKEADAINSAKFFSELQEREEHHTLDTATYEGTITGYNAESNALFVKVNGFTAYMNYKDWKHGRLAPMNLLVDNGEIQRGHKVTVKVIRFDAVERKITVSRKEAMKDPFEMLETLDEKDTVAGQVSQVSAVHGIFVKLDNGLEVKAIRPKYLEEPVVGDIVSCRLRSVNRQERKAKVVIVSYPRGRKTVQDFGSFLFS